MKKILIVIISLMVITLTGCSKNNEVAYGGVNAQILEISKEVKGIVVKGLDEGSILGDKCYINCENPEMYIIYADNNTGETMDLSFDDLMVGDEITVDINTVEHKYALTSRVQLLTQRK